MLIQTDQTSLLVVDVTGDLPKGRVNLAGLSPEGQCAATFADAPAKAGLKTLSFLLPSPARQACVPSLAKTVTSQSSCKTPEEACLTGGCLSQ